MWCVLLCFVFFFKQKTAYEMRISDWSSDVCSSDLPVQTTKVSVIGSINMLGLAKRVKVPILQAATSEVYGDPTQHPQTESYWGHVNPIGLRSRYDEGKRCAETLFFAYHRQHGLNVKDRKSTSLNSSH